MPNFKTITSKGICRHLLLDGRNSIMRQGNFRLRSCLTSVNFSSKRVDKKENFHSILIWAFFFLFVIISHHFLYSSYVYEWMAKVNSLREQKKTEMKNERDREKKGTFHKVCHRFLFALRHVYLFCFSLFIHLSGWCFSMGTRERIEKQTDVFVVTMMMIVCLPQFTLASDRMAMQTHICKCARCARGLCFNINSTPLIMCYQ